MDRDFSSTFARRRQPQRNMKVGRGTVVARMLLWMTAAMLGVGEVSLSNVGFPMWGIFGAWSGDLSCGGTRQESEFVLRSPGHPSSYPTKGRCEWTVVRQDPKVCGLEFLFRDFDLETSDYCTYDYLLVQGNRLCGKIAQGAVRVFMFAENSTSVVFVSDNQNSRTGFDIRVRQITTCSPQAKGKFMQCGGTYEKKDFFLRSPGYPANYSDGSDCTYRVRRANGKVCALKVTFATFHLEESAMCKSDYFLVDEKRFCGILEDATTQTFPFQGPEKLLSFRSDSSVSGPGFFAHVQQEECEQRSMARLEEDCSQEFRQSRFELRSPGYPERNYADDLSCRYTVIKSSPSVCQIVLNVKEFRLQEGEVCENDYLQVAEERLCGVIQAGMTRTYPFGKQDRLVIRFDTDSRRADKGFHLTVQQRDCSNGTNSTSTDRKAAGSVPDCDQTLMGAEDQMIQSPGFPDPYPPDADCRWTVLRTSSDFCELELTIHSLHIQVGESCQFDYLEVDGHRFCGSTTAGNKRIFSFKTDQIVVHFHSDSVTNDRGFEVTLRQRECPTSTTPFPSRSCDQTFDSTQFVLVSPNHPRDYDNGVDCRYVIRRSSEEVCQIEMEFLRFDVESSSGCEYDYLAINGEKLCGMIENSTRTYLFTDYEKQLTFHSDSGTARPGFMIHVKQVPCDTPLTTTPIAPPTKPCGSRLEGPSFELQSDNYPRNYDPHQRCEWIVTKAHPGVCAMELTFLAFDVEMSEGCQYDYFLLQDERLCGTYPANLKKIVPFEGLEMTLEFHSDGATARPGFHIRAQQMNCAPSTDDGDYGPLPTGCGRTFNNTSGTFSSPAFPDSYPDSQHCVYRFEALPDCCRISFHFLEFGLQAEDALCENDYLKIDGIKYCGPQLLGQKRTLTFYGHPREVSIYFESDGYTSDRGFYAVYRQLPCSPVLGRSPSRRKESQSFNCDRLYASQSFVLLSPNHPENYPSDAECKYTLRRLGPKICRLRLTYKDFDVESSEGCEYDWLEVDGTKTCGTLPEGHTVMIDFKDVYQKVFVFHSDSANVRKGFSIKVEQEECAPPEVQQQPPPKMEQLPQKGVSFPAEHLEIPLFYPPPPLDYDHLDYPVFEATALRRTLHVSPPINCDLAIQQEKFELTSPNFPHPYPTGLHCRYLIRKSAPDVCWVKLTFKRFDLENSEHCFLDYLSVDNKKICGTLPQDEMRAFLFNSDEISVYFRTDSVSAHRGFLIQGEQLKCKPKEEEKPPVSNSTCGQSFSSELFVLQSPSHPEKYQSKSECRYEIHRANRYVCGLQLVILAFDLEEEPNCKKDYLQLGEERLCGIIPARTVRMVTFTEESFIVKFRADGQNERSGFSILVSQVEDCADTKKAAQGYQCGGEYSTHSFLIESPSFPEDYPPNANCEYFVRRASPEYCRIELRVLTFDLEDDKDSAIKGGPRCIADGLELPRGYRLCGQLPKEHVESIPFVTGEIPIIFYSDASTQRPGFSITVRQMADCGYNDTDNTSLQNTSLLADTPSGDYDECGGTYKGPEFSMKSPMFPDDYPNEAHCVYTVYKASPDVCAMELKFVHFDIEKGPDCSFDQLDIGHKTLCGQLPTGFTREIPFEDEEMKFTFKSDMGTSKSGFAIKVKQKSSCGKS
ncbi:cubilin-like [Uloborus diversus]|uniref:cubilin-like n=1 Tax=Uloborus diversus TaxID=327109 RepID=UPI00240A7346|nr:cubilin-like [Uloborus diversus]